MDGSVLLMALEGLAVVITVRRFGVERKVAEWNQKSGLLNRIFLMSACVRCSGQVRMGGGGDRRATLLPQMLTA